MKAKIGITLPYDHSTGSYKTAPFYANAVERSGGIPFFLPFTDNEETIEKTTEYLDGIVFSGGDNIDPGIYGEQIAKNCGKIEYERDLYELKLWRSAIKNNVCVLGICRGCQLINVANGGSLYQHIDNHDQRYDRHVSSHTVKILRDTPLYDILRAEEIYVNSFHHQAVKNPSGSKICAESNDGYIESICLPEQKFHIGVQWHPERMYGTSVHAKTLFDAFVAACV
ncbi:MAG: gamma-glutamyl-gamma-aminobutyrate hydrolase family protein [Clostridia bacterium]|nr:gamma-glutamyl-gamma-aminobutyrate hydrolase family protein [Clostridia bacterium]